METLLRTFLRMVQREPLELDAEAPVGIESRLLDLASRDTGLSLTCHK